MTWAVCAHCPHEIHATNPAAAMDAHETVTGHHGWAVESSAHPTTQCLQTRPFGVSCKQQAGAGSAPTLTDPLTHHSHNREEGLT